MKKKYALTLLGMIIIAGVLIVVSPHLFTSSDPEKNGTNSEFGETFSVGFDLIGESNYDPTPYYERQMLKIGSEFTYWDISEDDEQLEKLTEYSQYTECPIDFDFDNYSLLITFGRTLEELEAYYFANYQSNTLVAIFKDDYEGNNVFFYQIDKNSYIPSPITSPCYVLRNSKRIYIGPWTSYFNEPDTEHPLFSPGV